MKSGRGRIAEPQRRRRGTLSEEGHDDARRLRLRALAFAVNRLTVVLSAEQSELKA
jgi:hypothetical protein